VGTRWETGRIEAFSDGVFAIAITLLVLDIGIPPSEFDDLWSAIFHEWPAYLGHATSFLTIGGIWLAHHGVFRRRRYANNTVMRIRGRARARDRRAPSGSLRLSGDRRRVRAASAGRRGDARAGLIADAEHDIARLLAGLDVSRRLDDLVEPVSPVDHGPVLACLDELLDEGEVLFAIAA
jgi:hypothetical protein